MCRRLIRCIPLIIWIILMLSLSSRPAVVSAEDSKPFEQSLSVIQEKIKSSETMKVNFKIFLQSPKYLVRKTAHIILYCGLYTLATFAFIGESNRYRKYVEIFLACVLFACFDEIYQTFIPGRTGLVQDVLIDSIGITIGCVLSIIIIEVSILKKTKLYKLIKES